MTSLAPMHDRRRVLLLLAGVAAAALYAAIVDVAASFTPGYDHVAHPISSLYQAGAPLGLPVALAFACYNILVVAFGTGVTLHAAGRDRARAGVGTGIAIVLVGLAGALDDVFPQDPIGAAITTAGTLHIAFAAVASVLTIVAMALAAWWLYAVPTRRALASYCIASLLLILAFGPVTAAATASASPIMGLLERVTIFTFILWMAVTSVVLARDALRNAAPIPRS